MRPTRSSKSGAGRARKAANEISFRVATRPLRTKLAPTGERPHPGDAHGSAFERRAKIGYTVASP